MRDLRIFPMFLASHAKTLMISRFAVVVVTFSTKSWTSSMIFVLGMCLFPEENQQPIFGVSPFSEEKWQLFIGRVKKTHFTNDN